MERCGVLTVRISQAGPALAAMACYGYAGRDSGVLVLSVRCGGVPTGGSTVQPVRYRRERRGFE